MASTAFSIPTLGFPLRTGLSAIFVVGDPRQRLHRPRRMHAERQAPPRLFLATLPRGGEICLRPGFKEDEVCLRTCLRNGAIPPVTLQVGLPTDARERCSFTNVQEGPEFWFAGQTWDQRPKATWKLVALGPIPGDFGPRTAKIPRKSPPPPHVPAKLVSSYVVRWERLGSLSDVVENSKSENEGAAKVGRKVKNHRFLSYQNQHRSGSNGR